MPVDRLRVFQMNADADVQVQNELTQTTAITTGHAREVALNASNNRMQLIREFSRSRLQLQGDQSDLLPGLDGVADTPE